MQGEQGDQGQSLARALAQGPLGRAQLAGATLGPWVVEAELGRGAMGVVLRARDRRDGRVAALKVLVAGAEASVVERRRFLREAELARAVTHPAVVPVLDSGDEQGLLFIAYELVEGTTLARALEEGPGPERVLELMTAIARGVAAAHAQGIVHRDLKPANILVRRSDGRPLVTDFGLARDVSLGSSLTRTGGMVGTPAYMAPEQAKGQPVGPPADVFALGEMLYEGLAGRLPFIAANPAVRYAQIMAKAPAAPSTIRPGSPVAADAVVLRALRCKPEDRFPDADALARALEALAPAAPGGVADRPARRRGAPALGAALVGAGAVVLAAALIHRFGPAPAPASIAPVATAPGPAVAPLPSSSPPVAAGRTREAREAEARAAREALREATSPEERRRMIRAFVRAHPDHPDAAALREEVRGWRLASASGGPSPRAGMERAVVWDPVGRRVLVFSGGEKDDLWAWDGVAWTELDAPAPRPMARYGHGAAWDVARGELVVFGGCLPGNQRLADTWTWDGARWREEEPDGAPAARAWFGMGWDETRQVVTLMGGDAGGPRDDVWTWDGEMWVPSVTARRPPPRSGHGMSWDPVGKRFVVFGGAGPGGWLSDVWTLEGETWTEVRPRNAGPPPRQALATSHDGERLLVFGGYDEAGKRAYGDCWLLEGDRWRELERPVMPAGRTWAGMARDPTNDLAVMFGGCIGNVTPTSEVWEFGLLAEEPAPPPTAAAPPRPPRRPPPSPPDGRWQRMVTTSGPSARDAMERAMVWDPRGQRVLVFAGHDGAGGTNDLWSWDGQSWARLPDVEPRPPARYLHAAAWDAERERLVVFGGRVKRGQNFADTWTWDGERWREERSPDAPSERFDHAMCWDPVGARVLLFGGYLPRTGIDDTWAWDGSSWRELPMPMPRPAPRMCHALVWDPVGRRALLFGGESPRGSKHLADVWALRDDRWTQLAIEGEGPSPRKAMTAWHDGRRLLVFSGYHEEGKRTFDDLWALEGDRWRKLVAPEPRPAGRSRAGAVHDPARGVSVLFGGSPADTAVDETWVWGP